MTRRFKWLIPILILCLLLMLVPCTGCTEGELLYLLVYSAICGVQVTIDGEYQGTLGWMEDWGACVLQFLWQEGESLLKFVIPGEKIAQLASAQGMQLTASQASEMPDITLTYKGVIAHDGRLEIDIYHPIAATTAVSATGTFAQNDSKPPLLGSIVVETSSEPFEPHPIGYPTISYEPSGFTFLLPEGSTPNPTSLSIWNSGEGSLNWSVSSSVSWLSLSPSSGTCIDETDNVTVSVDSSWMSVGDYIGTITISALEATNSPQPVPVDLNIYPPQNNSPQLSNPSVQPPSGTPPTNFYYYAGYYDSDGDSASVKGVYIDGMSHAMSLYSGTAFNGVYRYGPKNLSVGSHNYYFYFEDGKGGTARLPTSGSYSGPVVSQENNPPNTPCNPSPGNHATGVSINADLSWTGGDPDAGDTVTYYVYFGTSASPPLVSNDQIGTIYDPGTLSYNTKYYWKIVATDNHAASTTGPLWDFTTTTTSLKDVQTYVGEFDPIRRMLYVFVRDYDGTPATCEKVEWLIDGPYGIFESLLEGTDEACTNACYPVDYWDCQDAFIAADGRSGAGCTRVMTAAEIAKFVAVAELEFADEDDADDYAIAGVRVLSSHIQNVNISIKIHDCWEGEVTIITEDLMVWPLPNDPAVELGLAAISDELVMAYGYRAGEGVGGWTVYNPDWAVTHPEWNTLTTLYVGRGYWVNVNAACPLTYETQSYDLDEGWNLIGWLGA